VVEVHFELVGAVDVVVTSELQQAIFGILLVPVGPKQLTEGRVGSDGAAVVGRALEEVADEALARVAAVVRGW